MTPVLNMKMPLSKKSNWAGQWVVWSKSTPLKCVVSFGSVWLVGCSKIDPKVVEKWS